MIIRIDSWGAAFYESTVRWPNRLHGPNRVDSDGEQTWDRANRCDYYVLYKDGAYDPGIDHPIIDWPGE